MTPRLLHSSHPSASPLFSRSVRHSPPYPPVLSSRPVRSGARDRRRMTSVTRRQGTWVGWSGSCRRVPTSALRPAAPSSRRFLRSWSLRGRPLTSLVLSLIPSVFHSARYAASRRSPCLALVPRARLRLTPIVMSGERREGRAGRQGEHTTKEASVRLGHKTLRTWMKNSSLW